VGVSFRGPCESASGVTGKDKPSVDTVGSVESEERFFNLEIPSGILASLCFLELRSGVEGVRPVEPLGLSASRKSGHSEGAEVGLEADMVKANGLAKRQGDNTWETGIVRI